LTKITAHRATAADRDLVANIVLLAFEHDPLWSHALSALREDAESRRAYWQIYVDGALRYPWTWIAGEGEAIATWIPPNGTELADEQEHQMTEFVGQHLPATDDFFALLDLFERAHPREVPHYYLSLIGTHPEHRGKGVGMGLLRDNLEVIDAEHMPAYLESSNPANNKRYESVGFQAIGGFSYPGDGPYVTTMWRPAR
jgi:GNAT superfamily N-acetyltransferase